MTSSNRPLKDILGIEHCSEFWNNVMVSQLMVLYYKIGSELILMAFYSWTTMTIRWRLLCRQGLHILLFSCIIFWPLFDMSEGGNGGSSWSWRLNTLVPSVLMARLVYKGAILKDPNDIEVQTISRSSSPSELLWGPLQRAALLCYLGLYHFQTTEAAIHVAAVGVGDALAPWFGMWFGRHQYQMPLSAAPKTMEGSVVGVFLGTSIGIYACLYVMGLPFLPLSAVLAYGMLAAVVEGTSPGHFDNLTVPLAIHFSINRIEHWLFE
mmetsp:Transcript_7090/g.9214  ORF Transcript_7090/g.9214 Transcript_7090/m.9214 type:complete len:266 (+) Transcript_7090:83-880(+)|eukprot:CAMPEP_0198151344 /NCGR_PEP_ID=MMETSP1443-20131203/55316_1 /TAXON_ID=186043 /ORGANISM="Entomoneis sp., Strain CCMP2396" /LENGTH=265 /DNA_ID=CAMNT_0043816979 /DNA_START=24 /DNA_END=821 /DNA_ORIENTATION=-